MSEVAQKVTEEEIDLTGANEVIDKYVDMKGALMPVLQAVQDVYGYIPEPTVHLIAERLNVYPSQIYGVLTFYAQFHLEPRGKYIIRVCMGTACYVKGAEKVLKKCLEVLKVDKDEITKDGLFTVRDVRCIGACGLAPVLTVGEKVFGHVNEDMVEDILDEFRGEDHAS